MQSCRIAGLVAVLAFGAAVPAVAQVMPLADSARPPRTEPAGDAGRDGAERDAAYVTGEVGSGRDGIVAADLQLGWMFTPWLGAFASLGGYGNTRSETSLRGALGDQPARRRRAAGERPGVRRWPDRVEDRVG